MPHLVQVAAEARDRGGRVLGISQDLFLPGVDAQQVMAKVRGVVERRGVDYPIYVLDDDNADGVSDHFGLPGPIPVTLALDADGNEVDRQEGEADLDRLREMMRRALGELPPR